MPEKPDPIQPTQPSDAAQTITPLQAPVKEVYLQLRPESRVFGTREEDAIGCEQFRLLHARLLELQSRTNLRRLLITSAGRGEGKTHVATNLALTIARESNRRVLLVDADIRDPQVHRVYGISNEYGLTDLLRNGHETWKALRKVVGTNLYILPAGSALSHPLTSSSVLTLKMLLDQTNPVFDWVLIDSPPALMAADVPLLAKLVDGVLLVVRAFQTPRELVENAVQQVDLHSIVGVVLNGAMPLGSHYYQYYGNYPKMNVKNGSTTEGKSEKPAPKLS